jgi:4-hydroxy-tetrahydrodipicolinate synthase
MVGVTDTCLVAAVELARYAKECGATCIAAAPPYYLELSQDEILRFMEKLTLQSEMPLMLYNMPLFTRHTIEVNTVRRAAEIESIVGLKDTGFLMRYFHEARAAVKREDFSFLIGPEELIAECVLFGGHGGMAGASNLYPRIYVDMYDAAVARDMDRILLLQEEALAFNRGVFHGANPLRGIKHGLGYLGICSSVLTEPLSYYTPEQCKAVEKYVDEHRSKIVG